MGFYINFKVFHHASFCFQHLKLDNFTNLSFMLEKGFSLTTKAEMSMLHITQ